MLHTANVRTFFVLNAGSIITLINVIILMVTCYPFLKQKTCASTIKITKDFFRKYIRNRFNVVFQALDEFVRDKSPDCQVAFLRLRSNLADWYSLYNGNFFEHDESNKIFAEYHDLFFSDQLLIVDLDIFHKTRSKLVDLKYNQNCTNFNEDEYKPLLVLLSNYMREIKFQLKILKSDEDKHKSRLDKIVSYITVSIAIAAIVVSIVKNP